MNCKKIEVFIDTKIDEGFNDFLEGKINDFNWSIDGKLKEPVINTNIRAYINFEGISYGDSKHKIKVICVIEDDTEKISDSVTIFDYYHMYNMFEMVFHDIPYKVIPKPKIEKDEDKATIYRKIEKVYGTNPQITTEDLVRYTDFKDLKESFYLCMVLIALKKSKVLFHTFMMETLYDKLNYYGYECDDYESIKKAISESKTDKSLINSFFYCVYYFTFKEEIDFRDYKFYFDIIWVTYKYLI